LYFHGHSFSQVKNIFSLVHDLAVFMPRGGVQLIDITGVCGGCRTGKCLRILQLLTKINSVYTIAYGMVFEWNEQKLIEFHKTWYLV